MKIESIAGMGVYIDGSDIDTDRIMPARFLKEISFKNMGKYLFYDLRFDQDGNKKVAWSGWDWDSDLFLEDLVTMVYGSNQDNDDHSAHAHH